MGRLTCTDFVLGLVCIVVIVYLLRRTSLRRAPASCGRAMLLDEEAEDGWSSSPHHHRRRRRNDDDAEYFEPRVDGTGGGGGGGRRNAVDLQRAIDFSDVTVSDAQRQEYSELQENTKQIKSVDERYREAKRTVAEHGMRPGIMPNHRRRQLVEALIRRPFCGRRTRSWRNEFGDNLRGDVIPKFKNNDLGVMRMGRSDPTIDLHPGALGQVSGMNGQWISTENVPDNAFDDLVETMEVPPN